METAVEKNHREVATLGVPWEKAFGYAQNAATLLARFGAGLQHVVEEGLYVTDMDAALAVAGAVRKTAYGSDTPQCASTIAQVTRLAFPQQLIEISFTAVLPD